MVHVGQVVITWKRHVDLVLIHVLFDEAHTIHVWYIYLYIY